MIEVITDDNINALNTSVKSNKAKSLQNKTRLMNILSETVDLNNSKADKYWHTAYDGYNYLNSGSTVTLNLGSNTLADVTELVMVFSMYDTVTDKVMNDGVFKYSMANSNDSTVYDGFYDTNYISIPSGTYESPTTTWDKFFFTKAFNLDAPNKIVGEGTTQMDDDAQAYVLRSVLVKY